MRKSSKSTSPCNCLNEDVLREIFIHCVHNPNGLIECLRLDGFKHSTRRIPQLSVSRVCSSWRRVALYTPQLWNTIVVAGLTDFNLSIAREYLGRAGNTPVSITFNRSSSSPEKARRLEMLDFLSSFRLRALQIPETVLCFQLVLPDLPQRSVADLESLRLFNHFYPKEGSIDLNDTRYPKLSHVTIWGGYQLSVFSNSLRVFDGRWLPITVIESWELLNHCPSLEEATFQLRKDHGSRNPVSVPRVPLRHLQKLYLNSPPRRLNLPFQEVEGTPFSTFIEALALPNIKELTCLTYAPVAWSAKAFESLAHRSNHFPHLSTFSLGNPTSVVDAGALLVLMPSVQQLTLCRGSADTDKVVFDRQALNDLARGSLAPQLQSLEVGCISNEDLFVDMAESRMKNARISSNGIPAPFTNVVFGTHDPQFNKINWLLPKRQRGIPISSWCPSS